MVIEHIIAGNIVPHNEGAIPLTKESYDVENPQRRTSDFSKTITIPENRVTNQIFEHAFDVNVAFQTFDPNKKTSYQIIQDGVLVMDGYCRLVDVVDVDGKVVYKIQATGAVGNIYELIKDKYIADLDFSEFNHTYNAASIEASWSTYSSTALFDTYKARVEADGGTVENDSCTIAYIDSIFTPSPYFYPMIDKGGRTDYENWKVIDFQPVIFVREIITKMFQNAGFNLSSNFFDTTLFRSLAIMSLDNQLKRGNAAIKERQYNVRRLIPQNGIPCQFISASASYADSSKLIFDSDLPAPFYNTIDNEYDVNTGYFTPNNVESYKFQGSLNFDLNYTQISALETAQIDSIFTNYPDAKFNVNIWLIKRNGILYTRLDTRSLDFTAEFFAQWTTGIGTQSIVDIKGNFAFGEIETAVGEQYMISIGSIDITYGTTIYRTSTSFWTFDNNIGSKSSSTLLSLNLRQGETLDLSKALPKMRQSDLLSSIIKRFNLYLEYGENNEVIIEPRDDYFISESIDATTMVDRSKEYTVKPLGALTAREYIFTDTEDKDTLNNLYQDTFDESYGTYTFDIDNDFTTADKTITSVFAPSVLQSQSLVNDRVITAVKFVDSDNKPTQTAGKPRLLYVGGLLDTVVKWNLATRYPTLSKTSYNVYPYAGHLDNPYAPTFDLNWGVPKQLYYDFSYTGANSIEYPNSNCYNVFWSNNINEITDKNSKLLECYVALRPIDYQNFTFRKRYYIDGSYWRLLKIEDYDAMGGDTTKCLFLKSDPQTLFSGTVKEAEGGIGVFDNGDILPAFEGGVDVINPTVFLNTGDKDVFAGVYANGLFVEDVLNLELPASVLEGLVAGFSILPELDTNEFYEITRGYLRLNGGASESGGHKVDVITDDILAHTLASVPSSFFNIPYNVVNLQLDAHADDDIHFGSGLKLISNTNMSFPPETTLTIQLVYRIIKI